MKFAPVLLFPIICHLRGFPPAFRLRIRVAHTMAALDCTFPRQDLLPKKETGATAFLTKYPHFDGRGTVVAIFDSGIDPRAPGLQVTSDGKPKIIDRFDGSGSGDVSLVPAEVRNGTITGLSGRQLKIPEAWQNPSGKYMIGLKNLYELYPSSLKERILKEYKENEWDPKHKSALAEATRNLQAFEAKNPNPVGTEKLIKEDLEAQIEILNTLEKKYSNTGPAFDCIVYNDGNKWLACLDTSFQGDLSSCQLLGPYSETFDFGTLSQADQLSYSVNIYPEENVLEIVTMCSSHGTHVASIAAACFPDDPDRNGLAPGAQIVSVTIGDNRLGSMETGTSLVRAMIRIFQCSQYKIDVINMSYGEHAHWTHSGRIGELISEVVNKYGVIWVVSGSNHGPALSTVGTPPAISTSTMIGVGAYVSPEMMAAEYSLREKLPGTAYSWSSRGPCLDGSLGISICAPGGAITSVPNFLLRGSQLMNGTSMAAPHVTGTVALLVSGLKSRQIPYSPFSVKRAMEQTAQYLDHVEVFAQGHGLVQIDRTFDHMVAHHDQVERDVRFHVTVAGGSACSSPSAASPASHGIYMRDVPTNKSREFNVTVEPFFLNNEERDAASKIVFNLHLALVCTAPWVQIPKHLDLMFMARGFSVKVDPSGLSTGVHYTSVRAYDSQCPDKGIIFEVPITVVKAEPVPDRRVSYAGQSFYPGQVKRHFIQVPRDATWALLHIGLDGRETETSNARFVIHAVQTLAQLNCKSCEFHKMVDLHETADTPLAFAVKGGRVMELCVTKWWASLGSVRVSYSVTFHGIATCPGGGPLVMHAAQGILRVDLCSSLSNEEIAPVVTLKHQVQSFRPAEFKVIPLGSRDVLQPSRQIYELQLTYNFNVAKATEVTPNCALLSDTLYESQFESQLWMIFDANKQFLGAGDAYPNNYVAKLEKGDYVLKLHVRHEKKDLLDKLQDTPILISQKLSSSVTMDVYGTHSQALIQGKKLSSMVLPQGISVPIFIAPLNSDKCGKTVTVGQYLSGTVTYAKDEYGKKVDVQAFKYIMAETPKKSNGNNKNNDKDDKAAKTKLEEMNEAVRDLKISWIPKLENAAVSGDLFEELQSQCPDHLPLYLAHLQALEADKSGERNLKAIIETADFVIKSIDATELLEYYGLKADARPDAAKIKTRLDKQKSFLLEALSKKGLALCERLHQNNGNTEVTLDDIVAVYNEVVKFADPSDPKVVKFAIHAALVQNHYGRAVKLVHKQYEEKPSRELDEKLVELFAALKWAHCQSLWMRALPSKYPPVYRPF